MPRPQQPDQPDQPDQPAQPADQPAESEGFDFIDPTDSQAVADFIDKHGLEVFQRERLRQVGTTYGA